MYRIKLLFSAVALNAAFLQDSTHLIGIVRERTAIKVIPVLLCINTGYTERSIIAGQHSPHGQNT